MSDSLPTPQDLELSPELAALTAVSVSLELLVRALAAIHSELQDPDFPRRASACARVADDIIDLAAKQQYALARYRWAVRIATCVDLDDLTDEVIDDSDIPY
jgi:hypothetical protein